MLAPGRGDREHADATRPGEPLPAGGPHRRGARCDGSVTEGLGGVDPQRHAGVRTQPGDVVGRLAQGAVRGLLGEVDHGRWCGGEARFERVEVDVSVVVDLEQPDTQAAGREGVDVRSPFARRDRHLVVVVEPPPSQQGVERRLGALDEGDTVVVDAEQPPQLGAQAGDGGCGPVGDDIGAVGRLAMGVRGHGVEGGERRAAGGRAVEVDADRLRTP